MKIGLVGPSYQALSLPFNAERSVNLFPVFNKGGNEVSALYGTPGYEAFAVCGTGPVRGCFASQNGRAFVASGSGFYEVDSAGNTTQLGSLNQSAGNVSMAENGKQLAVCDGKGVYILDYENNHFALVSDEDVPEAGTITFIDGYFVVSKVGSGSFYISALYDGTVWSALDFATAESSPDQLLRVMSALGQLWLLGKEISEIHTNTGAAAFPFEKISGAKLEIGILAPHTAVEIDSSLVWVGNSKPGTGVVYRATNVSPVRISTSSVERAIQAANDKENMVAYAYQEHGHVFYVLTGGGLATSWVYDFTTGLWHERAYLNAQGGYEQHRGICSMFVFGKHLMGDRENGSLYHRAMDIYADDGDAIMRERVYTHVHQEGQSMSYSELEVGFESGVGLQNGPGENPQAALQISIDGGRTWSESETAPIGRAGEYLTKVRFRRIGTAEQFTFRVRVSDPVKVAICGSYLT